MLPKNCLGFEKKYRLEALQSQKAFPLARRLSREHLLDGRFWEAYRPAQASAKPSQLRVQVLEIIGSNSELRSMGVAGRLVQEDNTIHFVLKSELNHVSRPHRHSFNLAIQSALPHCLNHLC